MAYFFFSYAKEDFNPFLDRFYNDLVEQIRVNTGIPKEEISFYDQNIEIGEIWPESIKNALLTSRVFIYIQTPTYFKKDWCGKEWTIFSTRIEKFLEKNPQKKIPPLMIPVLWLQISKNLRHTLHK